jgi:hypothetical protein
MKNVKTVVSRQLVKGRKPKREKKKFFALQRSMARRARRKGVFTEKEVERLVFEDR